GGKYLVKSVTISSMLVWLPRRLVAIATISRSVGKNARNKLYAMACEIMLHGGNTRRNARPPCLARAFTEIMEHQYKRVTSAVESSNRPDKVPVRTLVKELVQASRPQNDAQTLFTARWLTVLSNTACRVGRNVQRTAFETADKRLQLASF